LAIGLDPDATPLVARGWATPRVVMDDLLRQALARPPCLVSFSGGRDSSAVLAAAALVARREGLPLPVPVTNRFPAVVSSREDEWQEQVVRHLDLPDWEKLLLTDELDSVGPVAQDVLRRLGLFWPFNAHFHVPLMRKAAGGSLLTGIGGDELFSAHTWGAARVVLTGRRRPRASRAGAIGAALAPRPVRRWALARRHQVRWPWLRAEVDESINRQLSDFKARTPIGWAGGVGWWWRGRARTVVAASMDALAADAGTRIVHPFLDPSVVGAVAGHFGARGPLNRSAAMRALFDDVLPAAVLARTSKAWFDAAFFSAPSGAFAANWTGAGVDPAIVDPDRLHDEWRSEHPDPRSFLLMQSAWLASR
jgi:asparagine synthetase B (glutamine-hydrolysing)